MPLSQRWSAPDGEEPPGARNTLQFVLAQVVETEVRSGNQVHDRSGNEDLTWLCSTLYALSQMYSYAGHVLTPSFNFTRMEACSDL